MSKIWGQKLHFPEILSFLSSQSCWTGKIVEYCNARLAIEFIAQIMCSYDRDRTWNVGRREELFALAEEHCAQLLMYRQRDDVKRIISHVDRLSIVKSFVRCPHVVKANLVEFVVETHKVKILREINDFVNNSSNRSKPPRSSWSLFHASKGFTTSKLNPSSLSALFVVLISIDPLPTSINLCPLIAYFCRHPCYSTWEATSDRVVAYLDACNLSTLSDHTAIRGFLELCLDPNFRNHAREQYPTSEETRARAQILLQSEC